MRKRAIAGRISLPHLSHASIPANVNARRLVVLTARAKYEWLIVAYNKVDPKVPRTSNPSKDKGGIARSRVIARRFASRRARAIANSRGTFLRIISRWPCSQRLRWVPAPAADEANSLVTVVNGQNSGGCRARVRSRPNFISSTRCALARLADRITFHGNAMPVPISWQGNVSARIPSGRNQFFTRHENSAT